MSPSSSRQTHLTDFFTGKGSACCPLPLCLSTHENTKKNIQQSSSQLQITQFTTPTRSTLPLVPHAPTKLNEQLTHYTNTTLTAIRLPLASPSTLPHSTATSPSRLPACKCPSRNQTN